MPEQQTELTTQELELLQLDQKLNDNLNLTSTELFADDAPDFVPDSPLEFSEEAKAVFEAGRELWNYYHQTPTFLAKVDPLEVVSYNPNASLYDIKTYFQGTNEAGRMNNKSSDQIYTKLIGNLREGLKFLSLKIQPKVYEFGFLRG